MAETRQHNGYDITMRDDWLFDVAKDGTILRADFRSFSDAIDFADKHAAREQRPTDWPRFDVLNDNGERVTLRGIQGRDGSLIFDPDKANPTRIIYPDTPDLRTALRTRKRLEDDLNAINKALQPFQERYDPIPQDPTPAKQKYEQLIARLQAKAAQPLQPPQP